MKVYVIWYKSSTLAVDVDVLGASVAPAVHVIEQATP